MNEITAIYGPAALAALSILLFATALVIKSYRDGSLKSDIKWVRGYIKLNIAHYKNRITAN